jgi:hypothetical protein
MTNCSLDSGFTPPSSSDLIADLAKQSASKKVHGVTGRTRTRTRTHGSSSSRPMRTSTGTSPSLCTMPHASFGDHHPFASPNKSNSDSNSNNTTTATTVSASSNNNGIPGKGKLRCGALVNILALDFAMETFEDPFAKELSKKKQQQQKLKMNRADTSQSLNTVEAENITVGDSSVHSRRSSATASTSNSNMPARKLRESLKHAAVPAPRNRTLKMEIGGLAANDWNNNSGHSRRRNSSAGSVQGSVGSRRSTSCTRSTLFTRRPIQHLSSTERNQPSPSSSTESKQPSRSFSAEGNKKSTTTKFSRSSSMEPPKFTYKSRSSPTERNYQSKPIITTRLCPGVRNKERWSRRKTEKETAKLEQDNKKPVVRVDIVVVAAEEMKKVEEKVTIENEKKLVVESIPTFPSSSSEEKKKKEERPPRSNKVTSSPSSSSDKLKTKTKTTSSSSDNKLKKSSCSSEDKIERKLINATTTPALPRQRRASAWEVREKAKQDKPARRHTVTTTTTPIVAVVKKLKEAKKDSASQLPPAFQPIYPKASFKSAHKNTTVAAATTTTTTQSHPGSLRNTRRRRTATTGAGTRPNNERTRRSNVSITRRNSVLDSLSTFTDDAALSNATNRLVK